MFTSPAPNITTGTATGTKRSTDDRRNCTHGHRRSTPQLDALDTEWERVHRRPASLRRARSWPSLVPDESAAALLELVLESATSLDDLVAVTHASRATQQQHRYDVDGNTVLQALLAAARHDELAARVVLQRILPGVIAASARYRWQRANDEHTDIAVAAAWLAIESFDLDRRQSRHLAAALISDVIWAAFRRPGRRAAFQELPTPNSVFAERAAPPIELDAITALAGTVREAVRAGVDECELDLIRELARAGSPSEAARRLAVTPRTIRNRRDLATASIRAALGPDRGDWTDYLTAAA